MFKRPIRTKIQTVVKKSDRKLLLDQLQKALPSLSTESIRSAVFPDGEDIIALKMEAVPANSSSGPSKTSKDPGAGSFTVYCNSNKQPLIVSFDIQSSTVAKKEFIAVFLPTVYLLWKVPTAMSLAFATVPDVISKLQNGADLMLAGVTTSPATKEYIDNNELPKDRTYASVAAQGNDYPMAVGKLLMSGDDLKTKLGFGGELLKGRLLEVSHIVGDELWALGDKSLPSTLVPRAAVHAVSGIPESVPTVVNPGEELESPLSSSGEPSESMDAFFRRILLVTLKSKATDSSSLPLLASTLNKHMLSIGRRLSDRQFDIKQTTFRKFAVFLDDMQTDGLISVANIREGVQAVTGISWKHLGFKDVVAIPEEPMDNDHSAALRIPEAVRQVYVVNGKTAPLFQSLNPQITKGYEFRSMDVLRESVSQYIKANDLGSKTDKGVINLDKFLMDLVLSKTVKFQGEWPMKWSELYDKLLKEMTIKHEVVFTNGGSVELKGKFVPINVNVVKRSGNKLITVIHNLEGLGMEPPVVARELQQVVGAAVNCVPSETEGSATVTVQGDQIKLLDKFFFQTHGMPKKFITGLEKAASKK